MESTEPFVKEVENQVLKPFDDWRDELYGYWMVFSDLQMVNGRKFAIARSYGTDTDKLYCLLEQLEAQSDEPNCGIVFNRKSHSMGGVFLAKSDS